MTSPHQGFPNNLLNITFSQFSNPWSPRKCNFYTKCKVISNTLILKFYDINLTCLTPFISQHSECIQIGDFPILLNNVIHCINTNFLAATFYPY